MAGNDSHGQRGHRARGSDDRLCHPIAAEVEAARAIPSVRAARIRYAPTPATGPSSRTGARARPLPALPEVVAAHLTSLAVPAAPTDRRPPWRGDPLAVTPRRPVAPKCPRQPSTGRRYPLGHPPRAARAADQEARRDWRKGLCRDIRRGGRAWAILAQGLAAALRRPNWPHSNWPTSNWSTGPYRFRTPFQNRLGRLRGGSLRCPRAES